MRSFCCVLLLLLLALTALPGQCSVAFQDELSSAPARRAPAGIPLGVKGSEAHADRVWAVPAGDPELRAAVGAAFAAEQHGHGQSALGAAAVQGVLLRLLNPLSSELSSAEQLEFEQQLAAWAQRQGLAQSIGGEAQQPLSLTLLQQQATLKFLRRLSASLLAVRAQAQLAQKVERLLASSDDL
jgi:hypothetical protein